MSTRKRATAPPRGFTTAQLDSLPRERRRRLVQGLLIEAGGRLASFDERGDHDDFVVEQPGVWRPRRSCVRVVFRPLIKDDVSGLAAVAREKGLADAILVEAAVEGESVASDDRVQVIRADQLVERLEASALVRWPDGTPDLDAEHYGVLRELGDLRPTLDAVGVRWLTSLSLNKLPPELDREDGTPEALFEYVAFRTFAMVFRFGGVRLGQRNIGARAPDALLASPGHSPDPFAALLDCKAARDGYVMGVDDERAFREYVPAFRSRAETEADGAPLRYLIILSSSFPGPAGDSHPYEGRAEALSALGVRLVYLAASDVVRLAVGMEKDEYQPRRRETIDWRSALDQGRVTYEHLSATAGEVP